MKDFFDTWKFKILVAVAVFLVGIMAYAGANGRLTAAPQELLGVVLMPLQKVTSALSGGIGSVWEKYTSIDEVMEQNEQLEAENAELRQQIVDYDRIKAENEAYKALARIQDSNTEASYISAFVIGRDPLDEFGGFTLDCGTVNGAAVNDAVISDKGYLIGMVVEADTPIAADLGDFTVPLLKFNVVPLRAIIATSVCVPSPSNRMLLPFCSSMVTTPHVPRTRPLDMLLNVPP